MTLPHKKVRNQFKFKEDFLFYLLIFLAILDQQCSCDRNTILISVLITFITTLGVSAVLSSVITYYCAMKTKNARAQHGSSEHEQPVHVYEETSVSVSREHDIKMGENVAYGPVVH